ERRIRSVEQAHEANGQAMERTAPVHERHQPDGTRAVLHEEGLGPSARARGSPAAAEPFVAEEGRGLAAFCGNRVPDGRECLEGLGRVETPPLPALPPRSPPRRCGRPGTGRSPAPSTTSLTRPAAAADE